MISYLLDAYYLVMIAAKEIADDEVEVGLLTV